MSGAALCKVLYIDVHLLKYITSTEPVGLCGDWTALFSLLPVSGANCLCKCHSPHRNLIQ